MSYIGNQIQNQNYVPAIDYFSGNGSTTAFTLSRPVASVAQVQAVISNVPQNPGDAFTVLNNTITFTSAPPTGTNNIYVYYTSPNTQVVQPGQGTVGTTQLQSDLTLTNPTYTGTLTGGTGVVNIGSGQIYKDASGNVGFGTNSPSSNSGYGGLTLNGTSGSLFDLRVNNSNTFRLGSIATENLLQGLSNVPMTFYTNNTERLRIDSSGRVTMPYQPAFCATTATAGPYNPGDVVLFGTGGTVFLNRGSYYNSSNGRFTAPVSGVYAFNVSFLSPQNSTTFDFRFYVNGSQVALGGFTGSGVADYKHGSSAIEYSLNAGDYIQVVCTGAGNYLHPDAAHNIFCGNLIG